MLYVGSYHNSNFATQYLDVYAYMKVFRSIDILTFFIQNVCIQMCEFQLSIYGHFLYCTDDYEYLQFETHRCLHFGSRAVYNNNISFK